MSRSRMTARKRARFLEVLAREGNVSQAARASGLSRQYAYVLRREDEGFAADWDAALDEAVDELIAIARKRAVEGVEEPVFYRGRQVGTRRVWSDRLLMFLIRVHRPEGRTAKAPEKSPPTNPEPATYEGVREEQTLNGEPILYQQMLVTHPGTGRSIDVGCFPFDRDLMELWKEEALDAMRWRGMLASPGVAA